MPKPPSFAHLVMGPWRKLTSPPAEGGGQALCQDVLAGGLGTDQQQVLAAEQRRRRGLPDLLAVVFEPRLLGEPVLRLGTDLVL